MNDCDIVIFIGDSRIDSIKQYFNKDTKYLKLNSKYNYIFDSFYNKSVSSGLYTVLICKLFMEFSSILDICGFMNLGDISGKDKYHYWEKLNGRQNNMIGVNTELHSMYSESLLIKELVNNILF